LIESISSLEDISISFLAGETGYRNSNTTCRDLVVRGRIGMLEFDPYRSGIVVVTTDQGVVVQIEFQAFLSSIGPTWHVSQILWATAPQERTLKLALRFT
jgi:hypothetical protein